ncbi:MAG: tetratricopeptide repeat protein [Cyanobacteria bacterium Co-bin8]|nr:tetratricopeptide repeat protein [Cyanobacteria bacterium Co-bin8]
MGLSIEVSEATFAEAVLQQSFQTPVLIDFFAQWCGPCQILKPILEKLAQEYDFVLAKVDIDQNSALASTYKVEGVPDVRIAMQGQVDKGFVGVLTEPQIRDFLGRLKLKSALEIGLEQLHLAEQAGNTPEAEQILTRLLAQFPGHPALILAAAQRALRQNQPDQARQFLTQLSAHDREYGSQVESLQGQIEFQQTIQAGGGESELDQTYLAACEAAVAGRFEDALAKFLTVVECDRTYRNDGARKAMITVFKILGDDDPMTSTYRKKLMQAMY